MTDFTIATELSVSAVRTDAVARIAAGASLLEVADALVAAGVGVLVVGDGAATDGVVSERDLVRALAARRDPATTRAIDIATRDHLVWCDAESSISAVANEMMNCYVRHVLVEEDGRLVGIVSARDLLGFYASAGADFGALDDDGGFNGEG